MINKLRTKSAQEKLSIPIHELQFSATLCPPYHHTGSAASVLLILNASRLLVGAAQKGTEIVLAAGLCQLQTHLHIQYKGSESLGVVGFFKRTSDGERLNLREFLGF